MTLKKALLTSTFSHLINSVAPKLAQTLTQVLFLIFLVHSTYCMGSCVDFHVLEWVVLMSSRNTFKTCLSPSAVKGEKEITKKRTKVLRHQTRSG